MMIFKLADEQNNVLAQYNRWFPEERMFDGTPTDWDDTGKIEDHYREPGSIYATFEFLPNAHHIEAYLVHDKITRGEELLVATVNVYQLSKEEYLLCNGDGYCNNDETIYSCPDDCVVQEETQEQNESVVEQPKKHNYTNYIAIGVAILLFIAILWMVYVFYYKNRNR